jgi:hypothetical protein
MQAAELPRTYELVASLKGAPRSYFRNFVASLRDNPIKRKYFVDIETELAALDPAAWDHLRTKVGPLFLKKEGLRGWQGAFSELNEAKAYNYLVHSGYTSVEFVPRNSDNKTPDLHAKLGDVDVLCEAKTINRSERAILSPAGSVSVQLSKEFFSKIASTIRRADLQMAAFSLETDIKRIVYIIVNFDDWLHEYVDDYLTQIQEREKEFVLPGLEIVVDAKPKFYSASSISQDAHMLRFTSIVPWHPPNAGN